VLTEKGQFDADNIISTIVLFWCRWLNDLEALSHTVSTIKEIPTKFEFDAVFCYWLMMLLLLKVVWPY